MKPVVKQKLSTLQDIINNAQSGGGGGTVDAYTKAEADAKFETKTDAASTYLSKSDAASTYLSKTDAASTYLSKTDAASTYLSKTDAASTYLSKTDAASTYLSKTDAASTYLSKTDAARMAHKVVAESTAVTGDETTLVQFTINNINSLSDLNCGIVIINCIETFNNTFDFMIFIYISNQQHYFIDASSGTVLLTSLMEFNNNTAKITKYGLDASQSGKKYRMTLIY